MSDSDINMTEEKRRAMLIRAQHIVLDVCNKNEHNLQDSLQYLALEYAKLESQLQIIEGKLTSCSQSVSDLRETLSKRYHENKAGALMSESDINMTEEKRRAMLIRAQHVESLPFRVKAFEA